MLQVIHEKQVGSFYKSIVKFWEIVGLLQETSRIHREKAGSGNSRSVKLQETFNRRLHYFCVFLLVIAGSFQEFCGNFWKIPATIWHPFCVDNVPNYFSKCKKYQCSVYLKRF